ncbi:hypothetical protein S420910_081 [Synechococcus phage S-CAM7]|uniref:Uncharacterized protein n=1 Tax=Synechococcus phage S-CAM7 TaxID=1883368 RepID=A0A1D8KUC0_9CAUD|nr:hypothetical protein S420910_081 [Synechococcus phage S-CAM7]
MKNLHIAAISAVLSFTFIIGLTYVPETTGYFIAGSVLTAVISLVIGSMRENS